MAPNRELLSSPRFLTLQHSQKIWIRNKAAISSMSADIPDDIASRLHKLEVGEEMMYSYFGPGLPGGTHTVTAVQNISAGSESLNPERTTTTKVFSVEAPQYVLPDAAVHSIFPPSGSEVFVETLPHLLFPDPYLPWERTAEGEGDGRNRMPWLALLVFSKDELQLEENLLNGNDSMFKGTKLAAEMQQLHKPIQMTPDFALNMPVSDLSLVSRCFCPVPKSQTEKDRTNAIFVKKRTFDLLTTKYDADGVADPQQTNLDITRYGFLAHVRHSAAEGMEAVRDPEGLFSVVHSHRVGPFEATTSSRAIVHLVSLEGWHKSSRKDALANDYVLLSSLYSWSYTVLPANALNVADSFKRIGRSVDVLRCPEDIMADAKADGSPEGKRIYQRMMDGYTLIKYHTQTGEPTAAIARGALIPTIPPDKLSEEWTSLSFSGSDLQIFDRQAGLMDLSYSIAWTLGKTLALADSNFTTSLSRLRSITENYAWERAKRKELAMKNAWKSKSATIESLSTSIETLAQLANGEHGSADPTSIPGRLTVSQDDPLDLSSNNPNLVQNFVDMAEERIRRLTGSDDDGEGLFNELNTPNSIDWMVVLTWVMDKMYLFGVPAHYLLADPSWLPDETLRFFYIDPHWVDALIDGALSLANHMDSDDDKLRRLLKGAFNAYFKAVDPVLGYRPQIPAYGFFLRSHLVKDFPDLHVTAPIPGLPQTPSSIDSDGAGHHERAPILRQERVADDTLFCLFDRLPGARELETIAFTQPAHQQYFVVGEKLSASGIEVTYKRAYTVKKDLENTIYDSIQTRHIPNVEKLEPGLPRLFLWGKDNEARFFNVPVLAADMLAAAQKDKDTSGFDDQTATSALVGYQLGCPVYRLTLTSADAKKLKNLPASEGPRLFQMLEARSVEPMAAGEAAPNIAQAQEPSLAINADEPQQPAVLAESSIVPMEFHTIPRTSQLISEPKQTVSVTASPEISAVRVSAAASLPSRPAARVAAIKPTPLPDTTKFPQEWMPGRDASAPTFKWAVYPIGSYGKAVPSISLPQDLVFSIKLATGSNYNYDVNMIKVQVPMGPAKESGPKYLLANYRGPGPVMLSNLRFNVLMSRGEGYLDFTLLPRSRKGIVSVKNLRDCSFLLPLAVVNNYKDHVYPKLLHTEYYEQGPAQGGPGYPFLVHILPIGETN